MRDRRVNKRSPSRSVAVLLPFAALAQPAAGQAEGAEAAFLVRNRLGDHMDFFGVTRSEERRRRIASERRSASCAREASV